MRRRVPGARPAGQNGAENDDRVGRDLVDTAGVTCAPGPLPRPSHGASGTKGRTRSGAVRRRTQRLDTGELVVDGSNTMLGRYGSETVSDALVAGWGLVEISSILRWALSDLAVALLEVERRLALSSHETRTQEAKTVDDSQSRLPVSN